eukprot:164822-Chlamydomonas_euryale.AAC.1
MHCVVVVQPLRLLRPEPLHLVQLPRAEGGARICGRHALLAATELRAALQAVHLLHVLPQVHALHQRIVAAGVLAHALLKEAAGGWDIGQAE